MPLPCIFPYRNVIEILPLTSNALPINDARAFNQTAALENQETRDPGISDPQGLGPPKPRGLGASEHWNPRSPETPDSETSGNSGAREHGNPPFLHVFLRCAALRRRPEAAVSFTACIRPDHRLEPPIARADIAPEIAMPSIGGAKTQHNEEKHVET